MLPKVSLPLFGLTCTSFLQQTVSQLIPLDTPSGPHELIFSQSSYNSSNPIYDFLYDHGCFCSKIFDITADFIDKSLRGGNTPVDDLDHICMDWMRARECSCNFPKGDCYLVDRKDRFYDSSDCGALVDECEKALCLIDKFHFGQLKDFVNLNYDNGFLTFPKVEISEISTETCPKVPMPYQDKFCAGTAPNVYIHRCSHSCQTTPYYTGFLTITGKTASLDSNPICPTTTFLLKSKIKMTLIFC